MISTSLETPLAEPQPLSQGMFTLGHLTIDDIVFYNETRMHLENSGGDALFSAIGARIWQSGVGIIARAGQGYPTKNIQQIESAGISCRIKRVAGRDIRNWTLYEPDGRRQFVRHLASGTYEQMSITGEEIPDDCLGAAAYHISPMPVQVQKSVLERLKPWSPQISLDQFDQHLGTPEAARTARELIAQVGFYLPSSEEAAVLHGSNDPQGAALVFGALGAPVVCIKMGTEGALLYVVERGKFYHIPIFPVQTVDPTGAGDSFCGGFMAGILATGNPLLAACYGAVSASYVVQYIGALNVLDAEFSDRFDRLDQVKSGIKTISS